MTRWYGVHERCGGDSLIDTTRTVLLRLKEVGMNDGRCRNATFLITSSTYSHPLGRKSRVDQHGCARARAYNFDDSQSFVMVVRLQ